MPKHLFKIAVLFVLIQPLHNCRKSDAPFSDQLPPVSETGAGTFGCKINGAVWLPNMSCGYFTDPCSALKVETMTVPGMGNLPVGINIQTGRSAAGENSFLHLLTRYILNPPNTQFSATGNIYDSLTIDYLTNKGGLYQTKPRTPGVVNITKLDADNKIISGTFTFTLYGQAGDSIVVTDGRFDLKFSHCKCY